MDRRKLLLQLLPGFIPLFAFIIADEIWGTKTGLIVAIAFGIGELAWYWIKDKHFDKFILFDTLLIVGLGAVSLILENDIFFKIKPALIGLLMCIVLGVSVFTPGNILLNMSKRYMRGIEMNDKQYKLFQKNMKGMFWLFSGYTVLVFYSVWFMSDTAWAFISGGLFYILFGVYFLFEIVKTRLKKKVITEEWLPLVNEKGEVIGKAPRSICHSDKKYLHPVVHLHVINKKGEIYLQKRPMHKTIQPGKWDTAVGGHISFGEDIETALKREAVEEIGIKDFKAQLAGNYVWESEEERELVFSFITQYDGTVTYNKDEVTDGRYWSPAEIRKNIGNNIFTPNFEEEFKKLFMKGKKF